MENLIDKTTKSRELRSVKPKKTRKMISEEDIRLRAYELYQEDGGTSHNELDDWFRAERELNESDR
jgi:hypothetical protein